MEGEALPPWPPAAAASEVRFRFRGEVALNGDKKPSDQPCTLRLRGGLVLSHAPRGFGPRGRPVDVTNQVVRKLDVQFKILDHSVFQCSKLSGKLIRDMLAVAVALTNESECKLPADAADSSQTPVDLATMIVESIGREIDEIVAAGSVVPGYDLYLEIPQVCITLVYEAKALLLACKEAAAAKTEAATGVVALCGRKRRREPDEVCAICLLDLETEDEEKVRLPCSHAFHTPCIEPWFDKASTCPTCRLDIMKCFSFVRSAPLGNSNISEPAMSHS
ncbi:hypothetical protein VPH35_047328 [Triticum aestivum]